MIIVLRISKFSFESSDFSIQTNITNVSCMFRMCIVFWIFNFFLPSPYRCTVQIYIYPCNGIWSFPFPGFHLARPGFTANCVAFLQLFLTISLKLFT